MALFLKMMVATMLTTFSLSLPVLADNSKPGTQGEMGAGGQDGAKGKITIIVSLAPHVLFRPSSSIFEIV